MAELCRWAFATFHAAVFVLVAVWLVHLGGALGDLLSGLDTAAGLGVYAVLWSVAAVATDRAFAAAPPTETPPARLASIGFQYGAVAGTGFIVVVVVVAFFAVLLLGGELLQVLLLGLAGVIGATVVGGLVGLGFALLSAPLVRAGERLAPGDR